MSRQNQVTVELTVDRSAAADSTSADKTSAQKVAADPPIRHDRPHPLLWLLAAAAAGIVLDRFAAIPLLGWCLLLVSLLQAAHGCQSRRREWSASLLLLVSVAVVAGIWHHDRWNLYPDDEVVRLARDTPQPVLARVRVLDAPRHGPAAPAGPMSTMTRGETTRIDVGLLAVRQGAAWHPASGRLVLIVQGRLEPQDALHGDQLEVAALLTAVRAALNPGEPDFAGMCRGRRQRAVLLCEHTDGIRRVRCGRAWNPLRQLGRLRLAAEAALDQHVGPQRSPLAAALLLGSRERLDEQTVQTFFVSGTLHLLAISGLHVGILATAFWLLIRLQWLPRNRVLWATCLLVVAYALLTGARPPVVRATILIVVYCLARGLGRSPQAWNSLAAAGLITLGFRPSGLFEAGTQLSFLAVASLIAIWPLSLGQPSRDPLRQLLLLSQPIWLRALRAAGVRLVQLLLVSVVVWLVSLPLVALRFHLIAPVGMVLNVLLWLPVAAAMFAALLTVVTEPLPILPDLFGACCDTALAATEWLTSQAAQLSWGHCWVAGPPWWWVVVFYVGLMLRQFVPLPVTKRWWCALLCGWLTVGMANGSCSMRAWRMISQSSLSQQSVRCSFVAVGHGTAVLIEMPDGRVLLYDAGRMGNSRAAALPISSVLWFRRIHHIDALVLSHADADHFNAVPALLDRFSVGVVYVSPVMFHAPAPALQSLLAAIDDAHVPIGSLHENMRWSGPGGVSLEVLHPPPDGITSPGGGRGDNANSIVLQLTCGRQRILLTGDLEGEGIDELLAELPLSCDVLLAPHHGSRQSRPADIARWTSPRVVVISAGASLPIKQAEAAYARGRTTLLWTHRDGMVEVIADGRQLLITTWRAQLRLP